MTLRVVPSCPSFPTTQRLGNYLGCPLWLGLRENGRTVIAARIARLRNRGAMIIEIESGEC